MIVSRWDTRMLLDAAKELDPRRIESWVNRAKAGDSEALRLLIARYWGLICQNARRRARIGLDMEDLTQEGLIGLFEAIRDFQSGKSPFDTFAKLCILRQIRQAVKIHMREKNQWFRAALSLDAAVGHSSSDEERTLLDVVQDVRIPTPEEAVVMWGNPSDVEKWKSVDDIVMGIANRFMGVLTDLERAVLAKFVAGYSYQEIADHLGVRWKAVDNALQRAKRKLTEAFSNA